MATATLPPTTPPVPITTPPVRPIPVRSAVKEGVDLDGMYGAAPDFDGKMLYAVRYAGDFHHRIRWHHRQDVHGTNTAWFDIAEGYGYPQRSGRNGAYKKLKGALTRSQRGKVATGVLHSGVTLTPVPAQCTGKLMCVATSYRNLADQMLSAEQKSDLESKHINESVLAEKASDDNFPYRMHHPRFLSTVPSEAGDYLVSTTPIHVDGLRVFTDGSLHFFSSDERVSKFVLTQDHPYVKENLINPLKAYETIKLFRPQQASLSKAAKRRRDRQRKKQMNKRRKC
jgi:hypothetical protein